MAVRQLLGYTPWRCPASTVGIMANSGTVGTTCYTYNIPLVEVQCLVNLLLLLPQAANTKPHVNYTPYGSRLSNHFPGNSPDCPILT